MLPGFVLALARTGGIALAVPVFASTQIPTQMKAALAFVLALVAYPMVAPTLPEGLSLSSAAAGMVGEFVIGEVIGLGAGLLFFAAQFAGKIVSHQTGLALGAVFNPLFDAEATVIDQLWF